MTINSRLAAWTPKLSERPNVNSAAGILTICAPKDSAMETVPSVEPESTRMISTSLIVCCRIPSSKRPIYLSSLYARMTIEQFICRKVHRQSSAFHQRAGVHYSPSTSKNRKPVAYKTTAYSCEWRSPSPASGYPEKHKPAEMASIQFGRWDEDQVSLPLRQAEPLLSNRRADEPDQLFDSRNTSYVPVH